MATVINNPGTTSEGSGMGPIVAAVLLVVALVLLLAYGVPAMRSNSTGGEGTNVNVPEKVQVDVNDNTGN